MNLLAERRGWMMRVVLAMAGCAVLCGSDVRAQTQTEPSKEPAKASVNVTQTFYLTNTSQAADGTEILTAIRNILPPNVKVYFVQSQNALIMVATPEQLALAQKILSDLDRPKRTYRLTYTITEMDGAKRIGTQHFAMVVVSGQRTVLKQGSKVPIVTGSYTTGAAGSGAAGVQTQVTYLDVGLNFDATLDESVNGVRLRTKAEQSSVAEGSTGLGAQDPVVRQTVLEGTSILTPGKPLMLGSMDVPGSPRHLDIDVMMEVVR